MVSLGLSPVKSLWSYNPIPNGCVLYLPLWHPNLSGTVFRSIDPFGETVTVTGTTQTSKGRSFDGTDDNIILPANWFPTTEGTIVLWAQWTSRVTNYYIFSTDVNDLTFFTNGGSFLFYYDGTAQITFTIDWATAPFVHLVITYKKDGACELLANGVSKDTGTCPDTTPANVASRLGEGTTGTLDFAGQMGEFKVYDRVWGTNEAAYDYNATKGRFI